MRLQKGAPCKQCKGLFLLWKTSLCPFNVSDWYGCKGSQKKATHTKKISRCDKILMFLYETFQWRSDWFLWNVDYSTLPFITSDVYMTHQCILFDKVGWPSLTERHNNHWYLFIHKTLTWKLTSWITSLLHLNPGSFQTTNYRERDWSSRFLMPVLTWEKLLLVSVPQTPGTLCTFIPLRHFRVQFIFILFHRAIR